MGKRIEFEGKIHEFPDDATDDEIRNALNALPMQTQAPSLNQAQNNQYRPASSVNDPSVLGFGKNLISSGGNLLGGIASAVAHPVDTATGLGKLADGFLVKMLKPVPPGTPLSEIPKGRNEDVADAFLDFYKDRYGGGGNILRTLYEDPLGAAADASIALTLGGGGVGAAGNVLKTSNAAGVANTGSKLATAGRAASAVGRNIDPAAWGARGVGAAAAPVVKPIVNAVPDRLRKGAMENYRRVLEPTSKKKVPEAEATARRLAERRIIARSRESMQNQVAERRAQAGPPAGAAYEGKPSVDIQPIRDDLKAIRQQKTLIKGTDVVASESLNKAIDNLENTLESLPKDAAGRVSAEALDDLRDKLFRGLVGTSGYNAEIAPQTLKSAQQGVARSIKRTLDSHFLDAKALNDEYRLWASAEDFLEDARRKRVTSESAITSGSAKGFGALVEKNVPRLIRKPIQGVTGVFDSVPWNTTMGSIKQSLAGATPAISGKIPGVNITRITSAASRANNAMETGGGASPAPSAPATSPAPSASSGAAQTASGSAKPIPPPPKVGELRYGYRFKGGDPADPDNWEETR